MFSLAAVCKAARSMLGELGGFVVPDEVASQNSTWYVGVKVSVVGSGLLT